MHNNRETVIIHHTIIVPTKSIIVASLDLIINGLMKLILTIDLNIAVEMFGVSTYSPRMH